MAGIQQMGRPFTSTPASGAGVLSAALAAPALSAMVVLTAAATDAPLGAPVYWSWLLTGLQVVGLWSAGTGRAWGWLLGSAVQVPWIAYAVVTAQVGFIPGCAVSAAVQIRNVLSWRSAGQGAHAHPFARQESREGSTWMSSA